MIKPSAVVVVVGAVRGLGAPRLDEGSRWACRDARREQRRCSTRKDRGLQAGSIALLRTRALRPTGSAAGAPTVSPAPKKVVAAVGMPGDRSS